MSVHLFLAMLRRPATTGSFVPSSRSLSRAMAQAADGADLIVELGAGTGPVTEALHKRFPRTPIIVVELQPELAQQLQQRFPTLDVRQDTADNVIDSLSDCTGKVAVVSSLPFRSLPSAVVQTTTNSLNRFLKADSNRKLVQFTYQPRAPFQVRTPLYWQRIKTVWRNTPPAGVWELQLKK